MLTGCSQYSRIQEQSQSPSCKPVRLLQSRHCEGAERLKQSPNEQKEIASAQKAGLAMTSDGLSMDNATTVCKPGSQASLV